MKILVLGANGAVGQLAIDQLLSASHEVKALVRNASTLPKNHPLLTVVQGDPTNAADLHRLLAGQNAVLSTLGVRKNKRTTLRIMQRSSFLFGRILMPLFLNHMYADAAVADSLIEKSGCDWVIVRPMSFTNGPKTGNITVITDMSTTVKLRLRISRADVAAFLVEQLVTDHYVRQMPIIYT